ncbi:Hypothetical protein SCF082_LOCUS10912 [Durusdinium trenchii]|uniref:Uncharacterized protein n=1 Tax=Durusdinium trenchii TaxID=1381693 RepID=A0ABP0J9L2_9DINO
MGSAGWRKGAVMGVVGVVAAVVAAVMAPVEGVIDRGSLMGAIAKDVLRAAELHEVLRDVARQVVEDKEMSRRVLGGDLTAVDTLLSGLALSLPVNSLAGSEVLIQPAQCQEILGLQACVDLTIFFPDPTGVLIGTPEAVCEGFSIQDAGVRALYTGLTRTYVDEADEADIQAIEEFNSTEAFLAFAIDKETIMFDLLVYGLAFECDLPIIAIPSSLEPDFDRVENVAQNTPPGNLNFNLIDADLNITSIYYAGPRDTTQPSAGEPFAFGPYLADNATLGDGLQNCTKELGPGRVILNNIEFLVTGLGAVEVCIGPLCIEIEDLNPALTDVLNDENDPNSALARDPVAETLCSLGVDIMVLLNDLIVNNTLSEEQEFVLRPEGNPLVVEEALVLEEALSPPEVVELVDIRDNVVVDFAGLFPGDDDGMDFIGGASLTSISELVCFALNITFNEEEDPILDILDYFLDTDLAEKGRADRLEVFQLAEDLLGEEFVKASEGFNFVIPLEFISGTPAFEFDVTVRRVVLSTNPRPDIPASSNRMWLDRIRALGAQTLKLPALRVGDVVAEVFLEIGIEFFGGVTILEPGFDNTDALNQAVSTLQPVTIPKSRGTFSTELFWDDFFFETAALIAVDEAAARTINIGSLLDNIFDCLLSIFYEMPRLTTMKFNAEAINSLTTRSPQLDTLLFLLTELLDDLVLPLFQGFVPGLAEELLSDSVVDTDLIDPTTCPIEPNLGSQDLFELKGPLLRDIQDLVTEDLVQTVLDLLFPKGEGDSVDFNQLVSSPIEILNFSNLPSSDGLNITLEFILSQVEAKGISPGTFTRFDLFNVSESNLQYMTNGLGIGTPADKVYLGVVIELNTYADREFRRRDLAQAQPAVENSVATAEAWWEDLNDDVDERDAEVARDLQLFTRSPTPAPQPTPYPTNFPTQAPTFPMPTEAPTTTPPTRPPTTLPPVPFGAGEQRNKLRLNVEFNNVEGQLDALIKMLDYDVRSTNVAEVLSFDCWMAKLKPYGGPTAIAVILNDASMRLDCIECTNDILFQLQGRFNNPQASVEFFNVLNDILSLAAEVLLNFFNEEQWDFTVNNFNRTCQGLSALPQEADILEFKEDLTETYAFMGAMVVTLGAVGGMACACLPGTHDRKRAKPLFEGETKGKAIDFLEQVDNKDHLADELEHTELFNHPSVPVFWRVMVPTLLLINLGLFVIGHIFPAVNVSILAEIAGVPIELEDFQSISVIESARALLNSGGILLAILIIGLSIMWPYIKIIGMSIGWFMPTRVIGFHKRGALIKRLDQLGKWSLIELYFLVFIIVAFQLEVGSPENAFLPTNFYYLELQINPQFSIYAFCTALVVSLFTSNVIGWYHEKIEKQIVNVLRVEQQQDDFLIAIHEFMFPVEGGRVSQGMGKRAWFTLVSGAVLSVMLLLVGASLPVFSSEIAGLARLVLELQGKPNVEEFSLFYFFSIIFSGDDGFGQLYLGVFFFLTVLVIPIFQLFMILYMLLGRFSLEGAIWAYDINQLLCAWCCTEVFIVGVGVTVLEVGQISGGIVGGACDFLQPIMANQLEPIDLVNDLDVQATCFQIFGDLLIGAYITFVAIILSNIVHYFTTVTFNKFVIARVQFPNLPPDDKRCTTNALNKCLVKAGCVETSPAMVAQQVAF